LLSPSSVHRGPGTGQVIEPEKTSSAEMALSDTHKGEKDLIFTAILAVFYQGNWTILCIPTKGPDSYV